LSRAKERLLSQTDSTWPDGFLYRTDFLSEPEERALVEEVRKLEFSEVKMHGVVAKRRTAHFGWVYGYASWQIMPGPPIPDFLLPVRRRMAELVNLYAADFVEALVTQYPPGAGIGWHRDAPTFGPIVVGISLLSSCRFRFQRGKRPARETFSMDLEPRSAYVLSGTARKEWQHSISATPALRYSITFRTLLKRNDIKASPHRP
jgi:alkylated DNA repair protein (DNA oxidative demethylase)